jgi:TPR repeat protein
LRNSAKTDAAAFERLKRLAEGGDKNAQFSLGTLYDPDINFSKSTAPDVNQSMAWYTKAAEQGHSLAQAYLGIFFYEGKYGLTQNFATAVFWFEKSAAQGDVVGERELARCYRAGQGVASDAVRAIELFQRAANQGDAYSENEVGYAYENGLGGLHKDLSEALKW